MENTLTTKNKLVEDNMKIVGLVIKQNFITKTKEEYDELFQVGCLALCKKADTYNNEYGKASTYFYTVVKNEIVNYLAHTKFYTNFEVYMTDEEDVNGENKSIDENTLAYEERDLTEAKMLRESVLYELNKCREEAKGRRKTGLYIMMCLVLELEKKDIMEKLEINEYAYDNCLRIARQTARENKRLRKIIDGGV